MHMYESANKLQCLLIYLEYAIADTLNEIDTSRVLPSDEFMYLQHSAHIVDVSLYALIRSIRASLLHNAGSEDKKVIGV